MTTQTNRAAFDCYEIETDLDGRATLQSRTELAALAHAAFDAADADAEAAAIVPYDWTEA